MLHLRPLRKGARNTREHTGLKEDLRKQTLHAPPEVRAMFEQVQLRAKPARGGGTRLGKARQPDAARRDIEKRGGQA